MYCPLSKQRGLIVILCVVYLIYITLVMSGIGPLRSKSLRVTESGGNGGGQDIVIPTTYHQEFKGQDINITTTYSPELTGLPDRDVAIIVPYRDRDIHLKIFTNYMNTFLMRQNSSAKIYVVEQDGTGDFNRAKLFNVGYREAKKDRPFTCFIFHDIDLIPENILLRYICDRHPKHMSAAIDKFNYKLPYRSIFGGVSALTDEHMQKTNGFSNNYWGWGGEDDDMYQRVRGVNEKLVRPPMNIARYSMLRNTGKHTRAKPGKDRMRLLGKAKKAMATDGLNSLDYKLLKKEDMGTYIWVLADLRKGAPPLKTPPKKQEAKETTTTKQTVKDSPQCQAIQKPRQKTLQDVCKKKPGSSASNGLDKLRTRPNVVVLEKEKAIFCFVIDAGAMLWKAKFLTYLGVLKEKDYNGKDTYKPDEAIQRVLAHHNMRTLRSYSIKDTEKLKSYYKFAFFMNPYERLYSTYLDKLTKKENHSYRSLAKSMIKDGSEVPSFENFLTYLTQRDHTDYDIHWRRYIESCDPCEVNYDYIGKVETLGSDVKCILPHLPGMTPWFPKQPSQDTLHQEAANGYAKIPKELLEKIDKIYGIDAKLFNYTIPRKRS